MSAHINLNPSSFSVKMIPEIRNYIDDATAPFKVLKIYLRNGSTVLGHLQSKPEIALNIFGHQNTFNICSTKFEKDRQMERWTENTQKISSHLFNNKPYFMSRGRKWGIIRRFRMRPSLCSGYNSRKGL